MGILFKLFYTFFYIGLFTFGGGYAMIPLITEEVTKYGWVSSTEVLIDFIAISESTPGPFAVNIATFIGYEQADILGAIVATFGVVLPSFLIILFIARLFTKFATNKYVVGVLKGIRPVVPGVILSVAIIFILRSVFLVEDFQFEDFTFQISTVFIFLFIYLLSRFWKKAHPIYLVLISAVLGIIFFGVI